MAEGNERGAAIRVAWSRIMQVFIVLHHEIMGALDCLRADELVFFVASNMKQALRLVRTTHVDRWSWWEIQATNLDSPDWPALSSVGEAIPSG